MNKQYMETLLRNDKAEFNEKFTCYTKYLYDSMKELESRLEVLKAYEQENEKIRRCLGSNFLPSDLKHNELLIKWEKEIIIKAYNRLNFLLKDFQSLQNKINHIIVGGEKHE